MSLQVTYFFCREILFNAYLPLMGNSHTQYSIMLMEGSHGLLEMHLVDATVWEGPLRRLVSTEEMAAPMLLYLDHAQVVLSTLKPPLMLAEMEFGSIESTMM